MIKRLKTFESIRAEVEAIKGEAKSLSSYSGTDYPESGYDDDDAGFAERAKRERALTFKLRLTNKGSTSIDRRLAILSGTFSNEVEMNAQGYQIAGIFKDGQVVPGATVGVNDVVLSPMRKQTWKMLQDFIKNNPTRLIGFSVSSDNTDMYETEIQVEPASPFSRQAEQIIDLAGYYSPDQFSAKKVEVDLINDANDFSFDDQNTAIMTLLANTTAMITFRFAGIENSAKKFDNKATKGRSNAVAREIAKGSGRKSMKFLK
jgi:hypothetical protein